MFIINRPQTDPYFNIAAEEYLLKQVKEDCFMLWVNEPSIIIGKHQNAFAEINRSYVKKNDIPVIRRITGGGTVFHDPGNLNFSFISRGEREKLVDFRRFTQPIIDFLNSLGIPARFEGKNDIRVNGFKISGNAEHVYKDRVLHHGTLLYSAQLGRLNKAIKGEEKYFKDKAVRSLRSTVANISDFLTQPLQIDPFRQGIIDFIKGQHSNLKTVSLSQNDTTEINLLVKEKYKTWAWNYGYSPKFSFERSFIFNTQFIQVTCIVQNGIITDIHADGPGAKNLPLHSLTGLKFDEDFLIQSFQSTDFPNVLTADEYRSLLTRILN